MIVWDDDMQALSGIPSQEALGRPVWDVRFRCLPKARRLAAVHNWLKQGFLQLLDTGRWGAVERPLRAGVAYPDGHEITVELIISGLETAQGYRILGACLKPDPGNLPAKATQEAYQSLIEHSLQGVVIFQGLRLVYANEMAAAITGYAQRELLSFSLKRLIGLMHPSFQTLAWQHVKEWRTGRKLAAFYEYRYQHPDGSERWIQVHTSRILRQGKPALQAAFLDVSSHKAAQDALQRSLDQERRTREMILALGEAAEAVLRARTASDVYRVVGEQVVALGYHAVVLRLAPDGKHLAVDYATYSKELLDKAARTTGVAMLGYGFLPPAGGYYDRILAGPQAIFDVQSDETSAEVFDKEHRKHSTAANKLLGIRERIGAPLIIHGQASGILLVNGRGLREEDVPAVAGFANQTAIALENAALIAEDKRQREALRALSARLVRIQEAEQARIARELHDETGQTLTAMNLHLTQSIEDLAQSPTGTNPQMLERLIQVRSLVEQTTRQIREMCFRLRPSILDEMGLGPALRWLTSWFERQYEVPTRFTARGANGRMSSEVETTLYRIVQEGLTNIGRYAEAQNVSVSLRRRSSTVTLTVEDDGVGFDVSIMLEGGAQSGSDARFDDTLGESTGLLGMRERVKLVGGQMDVLSQSGQGTRISVEIPLQ